MEENEAIGIAILVLITLLMFYVCFPKICKYEENSSIV
jgi:hypothetical protein